MSDLVYANVLFFLGGMLGCALAVGFFVLIERGPDILNWWNERKKK